MNKVIKSDAEYQKALKRLEFLMLDEPKQGTVKADELEVLSLLIGKYESEEFQVELPDPIEAIKFRMEQQNLKQKDLAPMIGCLLYTSPSPRDRG